MPPINTLSQEVINELAQMKAYVDRMRRGGDPGAHEPKSRFREKQVRIARTTTGLDCSTYPTLPANTFVVELGSGDFDLSCGNNTHTFTAYTPAELRYAHCIYGFIPDQTVVIVVLIHDKWYILNDGIVCDMISFQIVTADPVAKTAVVAVMSRPVGCLSVPEEIADGSTRCDISQPSTFGPTVNVCDPAGCHLNEPAADLVCRYGWAKYVMPLYVNICQPTEAEIAPQWQIVELCCPSCT